VGIALSMGMTGELCIKMVYPQMNRLVIFTNEHLKPSEEGTMKPLSERMLRKKSVVAGYKETYVLSRETVAKQVAKLEAALEKRLRQEYMDEDNRLGGIGITYEQFKKDALTE